MTKERDCYEEARRFAQEAGYSGGLMGGILFAGMGGAALEGVGMLPGALAGAAAGAVGTAVFASKDKEASWRQKVVWAAASVGSGAVVGAAMPVVVGAAAGASIGAPLGYVVGYGVGMAGGHVTCKMGMPPLTSLTSLQTPTIVCQVTGSPTSGLPASVHKPAAAGLQK